MSRGAVRSDGYATDAASSTSSFSPPSPEPSPAQALTTKYSTHATPHRLQRRLPPSSFSLLDCGEKSGDSGFCDSRAIVIWEGKHVTQDVQKVVSLGERKRGREICDGALERILHRIGDGVI